MKRVGVLGGIVFFASVLLGNVTESALRKNITFDPAPYYYSPKFSLSFLKNRPAFSLVLGLRLPADETSIKSSLSSLKLQRKKHFGRALLEWAPFMAYYHINYHLTHRTRVEGVHKYKFTWGDQSKKYFNSESWNFDANCFFFNWAHAVSGAASYNLARTNNLNLLEANLFSLASSMYWEFIVEYRSDISINDHIFTPLGGFPLGEVWYQLGKYFNNKSGTINQILGFLNPALKFNRYLDRKKLKETDSDPQPGWHEFRIFLGRQNSKILGVRTDQNNLFGGLHTQIISIPEFGEPGRVSKGVSDTLFSELYWDMSMGKKDIEEYNLFSRAVYFGYFKQDINEYRNGYAYYFGLGSALTLFKKKTAVPYIPCNLKGRRIEEINLNEPRNFKDKISAVHIVGPLFDLSFFSKDYSVRLVIDAYLDFAMVNSFALNRYSENHDISGIKTALLLQGYYYGIGTTLSSGVSIYFGKFVFKGLLKYFTYSSIEGIDRFQDEVTDDFHITDSRLKTIFSLSYKLCWIPAELMVSYEGLSRRGNIKETFFKELETRLFFGLVFTF